MPSAAIARSTIAPLFAEPNLRTEQVTQLVLGETAEILRADGEWRRLRTHLDGYEGWAHRGYLLELEPGKAERWRGEATGWSHGAVVDVGDVRLRLPSAPALPSRETRCACPMGGAVAWPEEPCRAASDASAAARAEAPERWALEYFSGSSYEWGGVTPWGVDCSGLVQTTFSARGVSLPRDSSLQVACGVEISPDALRAGRSPLLSRRDRGRAITHVAFAGEGGALVHSTIACGGVVEESWLPGTRAAPLRERLVAVRRMEQR